MYYSLHGQFKIVNRMLDLAEVTYKSLYLYELISIIF